MWINENLLQRKQFEIDVFGFGFPAGYESVDTYHVESYHTTTIYIYACMYVFDTCGIVVICISWAFILTKKKSIVKWTAVCVSVQTTRI